MRSRRRAAVVTVLASPSLKMAISTDSRPFTRVISSRSWAPRRTSATSRRRTGAVPGRLTMRSAISSTESNSLMVRTRNWLSRPRRAPPGRFTLLTPTTARMRSSDRPSAARRSWSMSIWISSSSPPLMLAAATPLTVSKSCLSWRSASRRCEVRSPGPVSASRTTGSSAGSKRSTTGSSASSGSSRRSSFSRTSMASWSMSASHSNSRITSDCPGRDTEWMDCRPRSTPTASSTGRVTRFSTSCGAVSGKSVCTVIDG